MATSSIEPEEVVVELPDDAVLMVENVGIAVLLDSECAAIHAVHVL